MIRQFNNDPANEFGMAQFMKPGSIWVLLHGGSFSHKKEPASFEYLEKGSCVMILDYDAKINDHLLQFLCGKNIYSCSIPRGRLRNFFGLLSKATQKYETNLL